MSKKLFRKVACGPESQNWEVLIARRTDLDTRKDDIRSAFARDYTRILHSCAFRRLKHKTQVFFNIANDHICTRMEHVFHVESVSNTIANELGLNTELTKAIAIGHDLGHAPFGHQGESVIRELAEKYIHQDFWHEKNGLRIVDDIELLEDYRKIWRNLNLTYAVRDGIISHCGEIDENGLKPRNEMIDLASISQPNQFSPMTWEACVVKIADKIAYIGRDIEDAGRLHFISQANQRLLVKMAQENSQETINTTAIMHKLILDICENSSPDSGICLSSKVFNQLKEIKFFNYESIYKNKRLEPFKKYSRLVITQIFNSLFEQYKGRETISYLKKQDEFYPHLIHSFIKWLSPYCEPEFVDEKFPREMIKDLQQFSNVKIYGDLGSSEVYAQAILDYISGMTDRYAIEIFNELVNI